jgi:murein DD-endopeptidase MepM/ murein hydrolase activator NlpD
LAAVLTTARSATGQTFTEPVQSMQLSGSNPYAAYNQVNNNQKYHSGTDIISAVYGPGNRDTPVYPTAGGTVWNVYRTSDSTTRCDGTPFSVSTTNRGLGNSVIVAHANGKYSLYGHLDCVDALINPGFSVTGGMRGTRLGKMGNSANDVRRNDSGPNAFGVHLHFEVKDAGTLGDRLPDLPRSGFVGYTHDIPDGYGYHDPTVYLWPFSASSMSPAVFAANTDGARIRSGPGTNPDYAILARLQQGQHVVAYATSGSWYKVHLPNAMSAVSGWVSATVLTFVGPATQVRVTNTGSDGLRIRTVAGGTADSTRVLTINGQSHLKVWDNQIFSVREQSVVSGVPWYKVDLPLTIANQKFGWLSGAFSEIVGAPATEQYTSSFSFGWNFFSIPVLPTNANSSAILCDDLSPCYTVWHWNAVQNNYDQNPDLSPGKSYWVFADNDTIVDVQGSPVSASIQSLPVGWHMIGQPFNFAVKLTDVNIHENATQGLGLATVSSTAQIHL